MKNLKSFEELDSLELVINQIEALINLNHHLAALYMALSIPDMLGKLAYPKSAKERYVKWFDDNVRNLTFGYLYSHNPLVTNDNCPRMCGIVCYALRCKLYHEGTIDIVQKTGIDEFILSFTDEDYVSGNYSGAICEFNDDNQKISEFKYFYISCKGLSKEIVAAAKIFHKNNPKLDYPKFRINNGFGRLNEDLLKV